MRTARGCDSGEARLPGAEGATRGRTPRQSLRQKDRGKSKRRGLRSAGLCFFFGLRASPAARFLSAPRRRVGYGKISGDRHECRARRQRLCLGPHHAGPAGGHRRVPHLPHRLGPGPPVRLYHAEHRGLPVPQKGPDRPRQQPVPLPGGDHRPGGHRGHGQHRRRHRGHLHRRTGGRVLDVGVRLLRHVHQIRRNRPGSEVPGHWLQRRPQGRAHVLH